MPKKANIKDKFEIATIADGYILRTNGDKIRFYRIEPTNLGVLSEANIESRVENMTALIKSIGQVQMLAIDARENFNANKAYLQSRKREEEQKYSERISFYSEARKRLNQNDDEAKDQLKLIKNQAKGPLAISKLLEKDIQDVEDMASNVSSARMFCLMISIPRGKDTEFKTRINNFEELAGRNEVSVRPMTKEELKQMIAVYYHQDSMTEYFANEEGEDYYKFGMEKDNTNFDDIHSQLRIDRNAKTYAETGALNNDFDMSTSFDDVTSALPQPAKGKSAYKEPQYQEYKPKQAFKNTEIIQPTKRDYSKRLYNLRQTLDQIVQADDTRLNLTKNEKVVYNNVGRGYKISDIAKQNNKSNEYIQYLYDSADLKLKKKKQLTDMYSDVFNG